MTDKDEAREHVCYEQNCEQARSLNVQMNQVPMLAMTLTGGLWFGAGGGVSEHLDGDIRFVLLIFAGACNLAFMVAILRIRDVLESYFEKMKSFYPEGFVTGRPNRPTISWSREYSMVKTYCALLLMAAITSFLGAFYKYWPFEICPWEGVFILLVIILMLHIFFLNRSDK